MSTTRDLSDLRCRISCHRKLLAIIFNYRLIVPMVNEQKDLTVDVCNCNYEQFVDLNKTTKEKL